jgi:rSAM/selenodomain-associated transferase 1
LLIEKNCVLFFVKYPAPGQVKVRLKSETIPYNVVELYRNFVLDMLLMLQRSRLRFYVVYHPSDALDQFRTWLPDKLQYLLQQGKDLGERLEWAFQFAFSRGYQRVIALGSDIPDLSSSILNRAFEALRTNDAVIGSSPDGGYYLIGFQATSFSSTVFTDIPWSSDTVFSQTCAKLRKIGRNVHFLPPWSDVDTVIDLQTLLRRNLTTGFRCSHTMTYLRPYQAALLAYQSREKRS